MYKKLTIDMVLKRLILCLYFCKFSKVHGHIKERPIILFDDLTNSTRCPAYFYSSDSYVIKGQVNISNYDVKTVALDKVQDNSVQKSNYVCWIDFNRKCDNGSNDSCYCQATDDENIYELVFNITLVASDSGLGVRAVMLITDGKLYSNEITLPNVTDLENNKENDVLKLNDISVNADNCSAWIVDNLLNVWFIIASIPVHFVQIHIDEIVLSRNESIYYTSGSRASWNATIKYFICGRQRKFFNFSFHARNSGWEVIIIVVLSVSIPLVLIFVIVWYVRRKRKINRRRKNDAVRHNCGEQTVELIGDSINLLMIGNSKEGKSATGNSILGKKIFESQIYSESITKGIQADYTKHSGSTYCVIDGPGFHSNFSDENQLSCLEIVTEYMDKAFEIKPMGFDAILLVMRFGSVVIHQEYIQMLKQKLGKNCIAKYCIIVITYKDMFDKDETGCNSIEEWVSKHTGYFATLAELCRHRIVYFDNKSNDEGVKEEQIAELLSVVEEIRKRNKKERCKVQHIGLNKKIIQKLRGKKIRNDIIVKY